MPSNYSAEQVLNQCLDRTDPDSPALRTAGGAGGGGGAITALPGDTLSTSGAQAKVTSIGLSSGVVIGANADRYELILSNTGTVNYYLNTDAAATVADGLPLPAGGERRFTGGLAKREWRAIGDAASGGEIRPFQGVI